jgi:hypothetical protein
VKPAEEIELYEMVHLLKNEVYRLRLALIVAGANDPNLRRALVQEKVVDSGEKRARYEPPLEPTVRQTPPDRLN